MKSKLRKEFEAFKKETGLQIWLLKNPIKFKLGDKLFYKNDYNERGHKCICKGVVEVRDISWAEIGIPSWTRVYNIESGNQIFEVYEYQLYTKDQL